MNPVERHTCGTTTTTREREQGRQRQPIRYNVVLPTSLVPHSQVPASTATKVVLQGASSTDAAALPASRWLSIWSCTGRHEGPTVSSKWDCGPSHFDGSPLLLRLSREKPAINDRRQGLHAAKAKKKRPMVSIGRTNRRTVSFNLNVWVLHLHDRQPLPLYLVRLTSAAVITMWNKPAHCATFPKK